MVTSLILVLALAAVHSAAGAPALLARPWHLSALSAAVGIDMAYVFLDLIPALADGQELIEATGIMPNLERHVFILALVGVIVYFWVEVAARRSRRQRRLMGGSDTTSIGPFRLAVATTMAMNAAIGYTIADPGHDVVQPIWLFGLVVGLHFLVNDHSLVENHGDRYRRHGRWLLVAALLAGWVMGIVPALEIPRPTIALLTAYIAGGIIVNVMRHELPDADRESDVLVFTAGAVVYGALVLALSPVG